MVKLLPERRMLLTHLVLPYIGLAILLICLSAIALHRLLGPPPVEYSLKLFLIYFGCWVAVWFACRLTLGRLPAMVRVGGWQNDNVVTSAMLLLASMVIHGELQGKFTGISPLTTNSWQHLESATDNYYLRPSKKLGTRETELGYIDTTYGRTGNTYLFFYSGADITLDGAHPFKIVLYSKDQYLLGRDRKLEALPRVAGLAATQERIKLERFLRTGGFVRPLRAWELSYLAKANSIPSKMMSCCYNGVVIIDDPRKFELWRTGVSLYFLLLALAFPLIAVFKKPDKHVISDLTKRSSYFERLFFSEHRLANG